MEKKICALLFAVVFAISLAPVQIAYAADNGLVTVEGLEVKDEVELYRICNYDDESSGFIWASAVTTWMEENDNGTAYSNMSPSDLNQLSSSSAMDFCQLLLAGLKNASKGIANLQGNSFVLEDLNANTAALTPGYYIILPKGITRVYKLKWFVLNPGEQKTITYTADDYSVASVTSSLTNDTADRGTCYDNITLLELDDQITATSQLTIPTYSDMYSSGKRVLNITTVIPKGMTYVESSLKVQTPDDNDTITDLAADSYKMQQFDVATLYRNQAGDLIFFGQNDYFYEMDGGLLAGPEATEDTAILAYNEVHGTSYIIESLDVEKIGNDTVIESDANEGEEGESIDSTDASAEDTTSQEGIVDTEEITESTTTDAADVLKVYRGVSVFIIALDTELEYTSLQTSISATKDKYSTDDGWYDILTALCYSTSPLDANLRAVKYEKARAGSYGIKITACLGTSDTYRKASDEILSTCPRMTDDEFTLYRRTNTYTGNINEAASYVAQENKEYVQLVYNEDTNETFEYTQYAILSVDEDGQVSIGGLIPSEYLIVQTGHVTGYALSEQSLLIEEADWSNESYMENNCLFDLIWLDFKTVYLPATGSIGRENTFAGAILLILFAILGLAYTGRRGAYYIGLIH